ncbi:uncharacterized protein LOC135688065 isoform X3 [Rhopilema esculentum]|uniref:uncharacterized protein LOC135688065 isoform X3 n=1 Tax=Rhopilema esculentum TaxID=499914 RepID=UPI0031DDDF88
MQFRVCRLAGLIFLLMVLLSSLHTEAKRRRRKGKCPRAVVSLTNKTGYIASPLFPKRYKNRQTCVWHIQVKPGYAVRLSFMQQFFGIGLTDVKENCLKKDYLVVSSRSQGFSDYSPFNDVTGTHSLIICGRKAPSLIINSGTNELWLKFHADSQKDANQIGFRAKFSSVDIDECMPRYGRGFCQHNCVNTHGSYSCTCRLGYHLAADRRSCIDVDECGRGKVYHGCSHHCENMEGSYRCICPYGMKLDASHKTCTGGIRYNVVFEGGTINSKNQKVYHAAVPYDAPLESPVYRLIAKALDSNGNTAEKPVKYYIIEQNNKSRDANEVFHIEEDSGYIVTRKYLYEKELKSYELIIEGKLDHFTGAKVKVLIHVNGTEPDINGRFFTVLIYYGLPLNHVIFNLKNRYKNGHDTVFEFHMYTFNEYFGIVQDKGEIYVKAPLPKETTKGNVWKQNLKIFVRRTIGLKIIAWEATVTVIMMPSYPGEGFLTKGLLLAVSREISKDIGGFTDRARSSFKQENRKVDPFDLHRMFRRPSNQARKISEAKLFFDTVMHKVAEKVKRTFGSPARSGEPIILRIKTGQILSPKKLSEIVDASKCLETVVEPSCIDQEFHLKYRTFDGTCNNIENPTWGAAATPFKRLIPAIYYDVDGLSDPIGFPNLPEAPILPTPHEVVQKAILVDSKSKRRSSVFSHMLMQWGQFIDHDITFTAESEGGKRCSLPKCDWSADDFDAPCFPIMYPRNGGECTMFTRSAAACQTNKDRIEQRQQLNTITSYMDASSVYGSSKKQADKLRALNDTGLMKLTDNGFLPFEPNQNHPPNTFCLNFGGCFAAGDGRVNEQILLASMHTLWVREHNRIARLLRRYNRHWEGEKIYQEARKIVIAEIQHITYSEYLPKILGHDGLPKYSGYKPNVDATVANAFAAAAYRFGHSLVRPTLSQLNENYDPIAPELPLFKAFFNNRLLLKDGIERFLFGAIGNFSEKTDRRVSKGLVKQLFQSPGASHGLNLIAINVQRGRDHGLQGYAYWREYCNLTYAYTFDDAANEIRSEKHRELLKKLYNGRAENADLYIVGLMETLADGAMVGPTFLCIIKDQFRRLRDGDRFYYENKGVFTQSQLREIKKTSLARVMCDNLKRIVSVQEDVFRAYDIPDFRKSCEGIKGMNVAFWRENSLVSDGSADIGQWSAWVKTVRFSTGTWASIIDRQICGNDTITDIQCQTLDGMPYTNAGENTICDQRFGVYCRDSEQAKIETKCSHYRFRVRCAQFPRKVSKPEQPTGLPREKIPIGINCTRKVANPVDPLALIFPVAESAVLDDPFKVMPKQEFIQLGKGERGYKKRALFSFDLRRIARHYILHSAKLQLYYVGENRQSSLNVLARSREPKIKIEVYLVKSSAWDSSNVTSRMPWHGDHLDLSKDVVSKVLASATISPSLSGWLELDVFKAVHQWRIKVSKRLRNYGFLVRVAGDDLSVGVYQFVSSSHENKALRPRLQVCLTNPMMQWKRK